MILSLSAAGVCSAEDKGGVEDNSHHNKRHLIRSSIGTLICFNPVFSPMQRCALEVNASINDLEFLYHILYTACVQNRAQPKIRQPNCLGHDWSPHWSSSPRSSQPTPCGTAGIRNEPPGLSLKVIILLPPEQRLVSEGSSASWMLGYLQCFGGHNVELRVQHRPAENAQRFKESVRDAGWTVTALHFGLL